MEYNSNHHEFAKSLVVGFWDTGYFGTIFSLPGKKLLRFSLCGLVATQSTHPGQNIFLCPCHCFLGLSVMTAGQEDAHGISISYRRETLEEKPWKVQVAAS